jgi:hypothetical protein
MVWGDCPHFCRIRVKATSKLTSLFISREQFEQQLGPLADVIEQDRRDREAKAEVAAKQLEAFGLAAASRESFGFEAIVSSLPCGAVHLARHMTTDKLYLVRQVRQGDMNSVLI